MQYRAAKKEFAAAEWPDADAQRDFARRAARLERADIARLLPLLLPSASDHIDRRRARLGVFVLLVKGSPGRSLYLPMLKTAVRGDDALRRVLQPLLLACNEPAAHTDVIKLLKSDERELRMFGAGLLKKGGGRTALGLLDTALRGGGWASRLEAMELAMELGGHHSIGMVGRVVEKGTQEEQLAALALLGDPRYVRAAPRAAAEAITPALYSPIFRVARDAMNALSAVAPPDVFYERIRPFLHNEDPRARRAAIRCLTGVPGDRTVEVLQQLYAAGDRATREVILSVLEEIGDDSIMPLLVDALGDESLPVRNQALTVVVGLARGRRLDPTRMLLWLLRSSNVNVRRQAVDIVEQVGDPVGELWPKLLRLLRDSDWWIRERVVDALVNIAGPELTRHVAAYLSDESDIVRRYAVEVLMRLKDPRSLGALVKVAGKDQDWWVRERAVECLGAIGDPKVIPHLARLAETDSALLPVVIAAVGAIGSEKGLPLVARALVHPEPDLRLQALRVVGALGDARVVPWVKPLASDADHRIRAAAKNLLMGWKARLDVGDEELEQRLQGLERMLWWATRQGGDDLFLIAGRPPFMKKLGEMVPLTDTVLSADQVESTLRGLMTPVQNEQFDRLEDVDFSIAIKSLGLRFRVNVLRQITGLSAVFRKIQQDVRGLGELGLPGLVTDLCDLTDGLVLIGGPTGSGKSTTLAGMIHHINAHHAKHIITIEDPIEVVHSHLKSVVTQREVGTHTRSFANALRATLREDPDVILVGEMRDLATIGFALSAAETGHLVFATVHTVSADMTVDRLIDAFPAGHQQQIRAMLSQTLRAVVCQHLLKKRDGVGRVPAVEILLNTDAVANTIRKGRCFQIPSIIKTSAELGMQLMDDELLRLVKDGVVTAEDAYAKAMDKSGFEQFLATEGVG
jgi:twitching motility protein PilT